MSALSDLGSSGAKKDQSADANPMLSDGDALLKAEDCMHAQLDCGSRVSLRRWSVAVGGSVVSSVALCLLLLRSSLSSSTHPFGASEGGIGSLGAIQGCGATTEDECVRLAGCSWFAVAQPCKTCKSWVPDLSGLSGCRDWNPVNYCRDQIYFGFLVKSGIKDPRDATFQDTVRHFHVVQGAGPGKTEKIAKRCDVWCDANHCESYQKPESLPAVALAAPVKNQAKYVSPQCATNKTDECLKSPGCRWFEMREPCELCETWGGDLENVTGCRDWNPYSYCRDQIFFYLLDKSAAAKAAGARSAEFIDVVQHFQITQGRGSIGGAQQKRWSCDVWCDSVDCEGHARVNNTLKGLNYGGRFVPEKYLGLNGTDEYLFKNISKFIDARVVSPCDISGRDSGERMARFLDENIKREHFETMALGGFDTLRLPLGYWNLIDIKGTPDGPRDSKARWSNLQGFMKAKDYKDWIDQVFQFAKDSGLKVLMDLHSVPGGQSGNQCTGCDQGPTNAIFFFGESDKNMNDAVQAVKVMAEICAEKGDTCYGIELLNEPHNADRDTKHSDAIMKDLAKCKVISKPCNGLAFMFTDAQLSNIDGLIGNFFVSMLSNDTESPVVQTKYRTLLQTFYRKAIKAARTHLDDDKPIVIMDWPGWLDWWQDHGNFTYKEFGRIVLSTHVYEFWATASLKDAKSTLQRSLDTLRNFSLRSDYDLLVTEYALNSHGSGQDDDMFDYNGFADWYVHQLSQVSIGSMIWNFDSFWPAWGSVAYNMVGNSQMDWQTINNMFGSVSKAAHISGCNPVSESSAGSTASSPRH